MKSLRLAALAAALTLAAACSSAPTEPASVGAPSFDEGPGMVGSGNKDGGGSLGSGNNSMEDGGGMIGSGNTTASTDSTGTPERGPGMMGSGN
jgi:hypothetical protein